MRKASKRSKRTPDKRIQFIWILALVALVCAVTVGYVAIMSHKAEIVKEGGNAITKLGKFISGLIKKK